MSETQPIKREEYMLELDKTEAGLVSQINQLHKALTEIRNQRAIIEHHEAENRRVSFCMVDGCYGYSVSIKDSLGFRK